MLLKTIIKPFYRLMNRLGYSRKFGVIMVLFAVPLLVLLAQFYINASSEIRQARVHSEGVDAIIRVHSLIAQLEKWRDITILNFVASDTELSTLQANATQALQRQISETRTFLQKTNGYQDIRFLDTLSEGVKDPFIAPGMEGITIELVFDNVHDYVEQAYNWQRQLATAYGLLGIADHSTFGIMNLVLYDVGDTYEALGRARVFGSFYLYTGFIDSSGTYVIDKTFSHLEKETEKIQDKLVALLALDTSQKRSPESFLNPLHGALEILDEQLIQVTTLKSPWRSYFEKTGALRDLARAIEEGTLYKASSHIRAELQHRRQEMLVFQLLTLTLTLLVLLLYTGFYYSVKNTITQLVNAAEAVASGDLDRTMRTQTHDELSLLGNALNNMREQLKARQVHLHQKSITDTLTGLNNRGYFDQVLRAEINRAMRSHHPIGLLLIDIDHFKSINDDHGHQAGDECLRYMGRILKQVAKRESDTVARYGGEEFAIILPDSSAQDCLAVAETIRKRVEQTEVVHGDTVINLTVSCGIASQIPVGTGAMSELIQGADEALYEAKRAGRNRSVFQAFSERTTTHG